MCVVQCRGVDWGLVSAVVMFSYTRNIPPFAVVKNAVVNPKMDYHPIHEGVLSGFTSQTRGYAMALCDQCMRVA